MAEGTRKAGAGSNSASADRSRANGKPKPKSYKWRGIELQLDPEPPGTLLWDFREFEKAAAEGEEDRVSPILDLLNSLIGDEQEAKIKGKVKADHIPLSQMADELQSLLEGILKKYGMGVGESKASQR